ncbi:MAG: EamA family transporter [Spirochaetia bacterium]
MGYLLLFSSVALGAFGQFFFKYGINRIPQEGFEFYLSLLQSWGVIAGFFCYGVSFILWMTVLKYFDLSYARPFTSLGYVITFLLAVGLLGENFTLQRFIAVLLITSGVFLLK